jgi:vacuolar-type H+-ATPase subunit F/Vma7
MSRVAAIGEPTRLAGYALSGADVHAASGVDELRAAWTGLPRDVGLLILTSAAHAVLEPRLAERPQLLWAVTPD